MGNACTSITCYLAACGEKLTLPVITVAGLVDGINPCAIGMILLLFGYLVIFSHQPQKILKLGSVYILTVYLTYLAIGLFFYKSVDVFKLTPYRLIFDRILGIILLSAGLINLKDFFWPGKGFSLEIPHKARPKLLKLIERTSLPGTILVAVLVTLLETPCSLPIYLGTAKIINQAQCSWWKVMGYFLYYNFLFVLPLIIIMFLIWKGQDLVALKEWEHKAKRWMKLSLGILLALMALWLLI